MIKQYFRRNFNLLFFTGIKALIFAKCGGGNSFLCDKTGPLLSIVLVGIFQAISILTPHVVCITVEKNNLVLSMRILLLASVVSGIQFVAHERCELLKLWPCFSQSVYKISLPPFLNFITHSSWKLLKLSHLTWQQNEKEMLLETGCE